MSRPLHADSDLARIAGVAGRTGNLERRPAPAAAAGGLPVATASDGQTSQSYTDPWTPTFDNAWRNDSAVFSYENVSGGKFGYIGLNEEGVYLAQFRIEFATDFSGVVYIEPMVEVLGSPDVLINSLAFAMPADYNTAVGEQLDAGENLHNAVLSTIWFQHTVADTGEDPLKIGMRLRTPDSGTKSLGAQMAVTRLGAAMTETTSF